MSSILSSSPRDASGNPANPYATPPESPRSEVPAAPRINSRRIAPKQPVYNLSPYDASCEYAGEAAFHRAFNNEDAEARRAAILRLANAALRQKDLVETPDSKDSNNQ